MNSIKDIKNTLSSIAKETVKNTKVSSDITNTGNKEIKKTVVKKLDYSSLKSNRYEVKEDVFEWTNKDISYYAGDIYFKRYGSYWNVNIVGATAYISKIKQSIHEILGFCDNVVIKDYIDFYFKNWSDINIKKAKGVFYLQSLVNRSALIDFCNFYDYRTSLDKYSVKKKEIDLSKDEGTKEIVMNCIYNRDVELTKRGFIFVANCIHSKGNVPIKDALKYILTDIIENNKKDNLYWKKVVEATQNNSPYPDWLLFRNYKSFISLVNKALNSNEDATIVFNDVNKFNFLRSNNENR